MWLTEVELRMVRLMRCVCEAQTSEGHDGLVLVGANNLFSNVDPDLYGLGL